MSKQHTTEIKQDFYCWRLIATGFCFFCFGLGGVILGTLVLPLFFLYPFGKDKKARFSRKAIQLGFRAFIELMRGSGVLRYHLSGFDQLNRQHGQLIIANHPSLIDVVFLIAFIDNASCIVKRALFKNPLVMASITSAAYIPNDEATTLLDACVNCLNEGTNLIIFPEGTRTTPGINSKLQRGAARVALRAGTPLQTVIISCNPSTLTKAEKWYNIPAKRPLFILRVSSRIDVIDFTKEQQPHAARELTRQIEDFFLQENEGV